MAAASRRPHGFTLVELLVVVSIIGILMAIMLPAIQAARRSSQRAQCQTNLRQIGTAFHLHHDAHGTFPSGGAEWWTPPTFTGGRPCVGPAQQAGWGFQILPYLEGEQTWEGVAGTTDEERAVRAIAATHSVFFCPARRSPQTISYSDPEYLGGVTLTHALCDYAASNLEGTGAVRRYTGISLQQITKGTSHALLVGDKRLNVAKLGSWQQDDNEGYTGGWDEDTMRYTEQPPAPDYESVNVVDGTADAGDQLFGSSHPGVFDVVLADGSVHPVSYDIDPEIFKSLGNISAGKTAELEGK